MSTVSAPQLCLRALALLLVLAASAPDFGQTAHAHTGAAWLPEAWSAPKRAGKSIELRKALAAGKSARVRSLAAQLNLNETSRQLLRAQLGYDMPGLLAMAKRCRGRAFDEGLLQAALRCDRLAYGAATVLGNTRAIFQVLAWAKTTGFPAVARSRHTRPQLFGDGFDRVNLTRLAESVPPLHVQLATGTHAVLIANWGALQGTSKDGTGVVAWTAPVMRASVNGHRIQALVDTGSPLPLVIGASDAKALGVKILVSGLTALPEPAKPRPRRGDAQLGMIAALKFGPLTLRNLAVRIVPDVYVPTGATIGLPVLARLKQVVFTGAKLRIGTPPLDCTDRLRATYAARSTLELGQLVFPVKIHGDQSSAIFDSGSDTLLVAKPRFQKSPAPSNSLGHAGVTYGHLTITLPVGHITSSAAAFFAPLPADVLIGAPLLATANVQLTFATPSVCIIPRSAARSKTNDETTGHAD